MATKTKAKSKSAPKIVSEHEGMSLSVVIPAYNEEGAVKTTVDDVRASLDPIGIEYEIIVVDDGSSDGTLAEARESGATVHFNQVNSGYGATLKRGVKAAEVTEAGEQRWVDDQLSDESSNMQLVLGGSPETCTPGYYNQEGTKERYRDVRLESYGKGLGAYRKVLRAWREDGNLDGLDLTT